MSNTPTCTLCGIPGHFGESGEGIELVGYVLNDDQKVPCCMPCVRAHGRLGRFNQGPDLDQMRRLARIFWNLRPVELTPLFRRSLTEVGEAVLVEHIENQVATKAEVKAAFERVLAIERAEESRNVSGRGHYAGEAMRWLFESSIYKAMQAT